MKLPRSSLVTATPRWLYRLTTNRLPEEHRRALRAVRLLLAPYRSLQLSFILSNLVVGVLECSSMAMLALVLQLLMGNGSALLGPDSTIGKVLQELQETCGAGRLVMILLGAAIVLQVLRSGLQFASEVMGATLQTRVTEDSRSRLLHCFLDMDYQVFSRYKLGRLQSYFEQSQHVGLLVGCSSKLLIQLSVVVAYVVLLLWISGVMTLAAVAVLAVLSWPIARILRRVKGAAREFVQASAAANEQLAECLQAFRPLHAFGLQPHATAQAAACFRECGKSQRRKLVWGAVIPPLFETICIGGGLALLLVGVGMAHGTGGQVLAELLSFTLVLYRLMPRINHVNTYLAGVVANWPSIQRLAPFLDADPRRAALGKGAPVPTAWQAIRFEGVSFLHRAGNREAVSELSLVVPRRSMIAIVGTSGAGKSTLANLLLRFYEPTAGRLAIDDANLAELDRQEWRARIGVVDQEGFLFHASVRENIRFGKLNATEDEITCAAEAAGAHEFIARLPKGYDTVIGDRGHRLSGGQRQRLAIARAVLRDPEILILDEATSNLDSRSERLVQQSIERLRSDRTIIAISHRLSTIIMADQIVVLDRGRLVEQGTHHELMERNELYAQLWRLQSEAPAEDEQAA